MELDLTKIEGFDSMTPEEQVDALKNYVGTIEMPKDSSKELEQLKQIISQKNSESADWKKKYQSTLSEQEQAKASREEELNLLREENKLLKMQQQIAELTGEYIKQGYTQELAKDTATAMYNGDFAKVMANSSKFKEDLEKSIRAETTRQTPRPNGNGETGTQYKTKEDILNIKDTVSRQKAIAENIELFNKGEE